MVVDRGYKYTEKLRGGVQWFMMESKDIISSICFKLRNDNNQIVSFNGQSVTFRLSIRENWKFKRWIHILEYTYNYLSIYTRDIHIIMFHSIIRVFIQYCFQHYKWLEHY